MHRPLQIECKDQKGFLSTALLQDAIEGLMGAGYFSCLDLKVGFWQITMDEASKQYTTFMVGSLGFLECEQMPFGLCNTPVTFQRLMQNCLGKLNLSYCLIYLDDVIVFFSKLKKSIWGACVSCSNASKNIT